MGSRRKAQPTPRGWTAEDRQELVSLVTAFEKVERVRVSERIRATHLAKRVQCSCEAFWTPTVDSETGEKKTCPKCAASVEQSTPAPFTQPFLTETILPQLEKIEEQVEARLCDLIRAHPAYGWAVGVKGVGQLNLAYVLGKCDMARYGSVSSFWAHCGWGLKKYCANEVCGKRFIPADPDAEQKTCKECGGTETVAKPQRKRAGEKVDYDVRLQSRCTIVAECLLRARGPYFRFFQAERERAKLAGCNDGRAHNRGFRHLIKLFLAHLWEVARRAEGLPTPPAYVFSIMGHTNKIEPEAMLGD